MNRRSFFGFLAAPFFAPLARLVKWVNPWPRAPLPEREILTHETALEIFGELYGERMAEEAHRDVWLLDQFKKSSRRLAGVHWTVPEHVDPESLS